MNDPRQNPTDGEKVSLTVLPHSGKADRLREESAGPPARPAPTVANISHVNRTENSGLGALSQSAVEQKVVGALREVYDPELPVNIYDLGLIYDIAIDAENNVKVRMTLTAPACPVAGTLPPMVERKIEAVAEVKSAAVDLVWDPPWAKEMMSEVARFELNL